MAIERLDTAILEALCSVLGGTGDGLTKSEIGGLLCQCQIDDVAPGIMKRYRFRRCWLSVSSATAWPTTCSPSCR
jgi:hypothetical protein